VAKPEKTAPPAPEQATRAPEAPELRAGERAVRVVFEATVTKVTDAMKTELAALAGKLKEKSQLRLQLLSYAGGGDISTSKARRMSLSRALSVRSYLIAEGVRSTRIDVRALGNKTTETPVNRVDIKVVQR
jgi:outer membrane protein OmpA-like peptidoglycan-associated protein